MVLPGEDCSASGIARGFNDSRLPQLDRCACLSPTVKRSDSDAWCGSDLKLGSDSDGDASVRFRVMAPASESFKLLSHGEDRCRMDSDSSESFRVTKTV